MKIGASTLATFSQGLENSLDFFEDNNIEYVELLHDYPSREMDTEKLKSFSLKYTLHSPIMDVNISSLNPAVRRASVDEIKYSLDVANRLDIETVVVHPGKVPFLAQGMEERIDELNRDSIKKLGEYADELGVQAVIENMPDIMGFTYKSLEGLETMLDDLDMKMCLDIGHANTNGYLAEEMYSPLVGHMHVHDNMADDDTHLAIGDGNVDFNRLISLFESKGYDGIYMIEVNRKEDILKSMDYLRNFKG